MKSNVVYKTFYLIGSLSLVPTIAVAFFSFTVKIDSRFEKIQIGTSVSEIKKGWGKPDEEFIFHNSPEKKVVKYSSVFGSYIFIFNCENTLVAKYFDD